MAGRPKGSKNLPKLCDYLGKERIDKLAEKAYEVAIEKGDATMLKFLLEQIYGKAAQPITGADGEDLFPKPILANILNKKDENNKQGDIISETENL